MCLDRFFSQHIHSFWLSLSPSGYLSQLGLMPSHANGSTFDLFSFHFLPPLDLFLLPLHPTNMGQNSGTESSLLNFSLWYLYSLLCPTPRHKFRCVQLLLRAICIFLFVCSACKIKFILSRMILSCYWSGKVEYIARWQSCSAQCFELAKFFSKVWIFKGRKRSFWYI